MQRPVRPAQIPQRRAIDEQEQIKIVKERLEEAMRKDQLKTTQINTSVFTSHQDVLDRLVPFHIYQINNKFSNDVDCALDLKGLEETLYKGYELLEKVDQMYLQVNLKFLEMVDQSMDDQE